MENNSILRRIKIKRSTPKPTYSKFYKRFKAIYWGCFFLIIFQIFLIFSGIMSVTYGNNSGWFSIILNSLIIPINIYNMIKCKKSMRREEDDLIKTESEKFNF